MMTLSGRRKAPEDVRKLTLLILKDSGQQKMIVMESRRNLLLIQVLAGAKKCGASSGDPKSPPQPRLPGSVVGEVSMPGAGNGDKITRGIVLK